MAQSIGDPLCIHPEAAERNECSSLERGGRTNELEIFEAALSCILQEENPLPVPQNELRKAELSRRLCDSGGLHCSDPAAEGQTREGLDGKDLGLLTKLLNQVRQLKAKESQSDIPSGEVHLVDSADLQESERKVQNQQTTMERTPSQLRNKVESVAKVASAAAEAAKTAAASASKNFEVMESLLTTLNKSDTQHDSAKASCSSEASKEECDGVAGASDIDDHTKKLVKVVEKQNKITHWILGFMVITTAIWRFKALSVVFGVHKTITNPFHAIGDMFSDGFKGFTKDEPNSSKSFQKARTVLPSLLQGGLNEASKGSESASSEDVKSGEGLIVSLDNILSIGKSSNNQSAGNSSNQSDG